MSISFLTCAQEFVLHEIHEYLSVLIYDSFIPKFGSSRVIFEVFDIRHW